MTICCISIQYLGNMKEMLQVIPTVSMFMSMVMMHLGLSFMNFCLLLTVTDMIFSGNVLETPKSYCTVKNAVIKVSKVTMNIGTPLMAPTCDLTLLQISFSNVDQIGKKYT